MGAFGKTGKLFRKFVIAQKEITVKDYLADMFATIVPRFQGQGGRRARCLFAFDLGGPDGGKWTVFIKDTVCKITTTIEGKPTVTLEFNEAKDYVDFILGKIDAQSILAAGKAAAKGDINMMASKWPILFENTKTHGRQRPGTGTPRAQKDHIGEPEVFNRSHHGQVPQGAER